MPLREVLKIKYKLTLLDIYTKCRIRLNIHFNICVCYLRIYL